MWCRVGSILIIVIAVVIALLACSTFAMQIQNYLLIVAKFFDVMLPILGAGALLKYLLKGQDCKCGCGCGSQNSCSTTK